MPFYFLFPIIQYDFWISKDLFFKDIQKCNSGYPKINYGYPKMQLRARLIPINRFKTSVIYL